MKLKRKPGLYRIVNKINNKIYVGKAANIYFRCKRHLRDLEKGIHHNKHLQRAFNKYGKDAFEFEAIEYTNDNLLEKEVRLIEKFDSYNNGYNLTKGGEGFNGLVFSNEHKKNLSKSHMGQKAWNKGLSPPLNVRQKKMILKTKNDVEILIQRVNNGELFKDLAKEYGCHPKTLSRAIKRYYGGYYDEVQ